MNGRLEIPVEIVGRHEPYDADDGYLLCARDDEIWPCDSAQLLGLIYEHNDGRSRPEDKEEAK